LPSVDVRPPATGSREHALTAGDLVLRVGSPSLVVLVGAAGSGKTTLAARLFAPDEVISSDDLRAAISGEAADQRATRPAFAILHREVMRRLAAGRLVVVDATSVEREARRALLRRAAAAGVPVTAVVLGLPSDIVQARNAARLERPVPAEVVERHLAKVARLLGADDAAADQTLRAEGFATVIVVRSDDDVARFRIERAPPVSPP
jgi:protein phosphatase